MSSKRAVGVKRKVGEDEELLERLAAAGSEEAAAHHHHNPSTIQPLSLTHTNAQPHPEAPQARPHPLGGTGGGLLGDGVVPADVGSPAVVAANGGREGDGKDSGDGGRPPGSSDGRLSSVSPLDVLSQCQSIQHHMLSLRGDVPTSSTVLRRALTAVAACVRQAELRVLRERVLRCLPPGSLTEKGDQMATMGIDEEISKIETAFQQLDKSSEQRCFKEGISISFAERYVSGEDGVAKGDGSHDFATGDKSTLGARLRDVQFPRRYRAREFNRSGSIFRELRLTSTASIRHQPTRGEKARNCALCKERETLYECRDCRVPLCTSQIRGFKDTCMAKWHEALDLTEEERARTGIVKEKKKAGKEERKRRKREEEEGRDGTALDADGRVRVGVGIGSRRDDEDEDDDDDDDDIEDDGGSGDGEESGAGHGAWDRYQASNYALKSV